MPPRHAVFSRIVWLSVGICALVLAMACARNAGTNAPAAEAVLGEPVEEGVIIAEAEPVPRAVEKPRKRSLEEVESELEEVRWKNMLLKEENDWLRAEVIRLNQALYEASQNIYSLNRKLDAIFKPENSGK